MPGVVTGGESAGGRKRSRSCRTESDAGWLWLGWFGLVLSIVGLSDVLLAWIPLRLGNRQWEFATVVQTFSGLPLITMGFAGLLGAGVALRRRWLVGTMGWVMLVAGIALGVTLALFLLDVPVILDAASGAAAIGVRKAIIKTTILGVAFGVTYLVGAVAAFRHMSTTRRSA